ncbi:MAG: hypothetical protein WAM39_17395 [Bryobacteraceae bacterium]
MKLAALLTFSYATCLAASGSDRPVCNKMTAGELWPPQAKTHRAAFWRLSQSGELEVCSRAPWHYRWESLTVNVHYLAARQRTQGDAGEGSKSSPAGASQNQLEQSSGN